jgi:hypothetical protein
MSMVLAFSPNTVAAVAAAGIVEVKAVWLRGVPMDNGVCGSLADVAAMTYVFFMSAVYTVPLLVVAAVYGLPGLMAMFWSLACEFVVRPWQFVTMGHFDLSDFWIALPVLLAFVLGNFLIVAIMWCLVAALEWRYPEIAQQVRTTKGKNSKIRLASGIPVNVVGCVREVTGWQGSPKLPQDVICNGPGIADSEFEMDLLPKDCEDQDDTPPKGLAIFGRSSEEENACVLNDTALASLWVVKVIICVAMPMLQVCVVITAKMLLESQWPWTATLEVFGERTWGRYFERIEQRGSSGVLPLLWYYT